MAYSSFRSNPETESRAGHRRKSPPIRFRRRCRGEVLEQLRTEGESFHPEGRRRQAVRSVTWINRSGRSLLPPPAHQARSAALLRAGLALLVAAFARSTAHSDPLPNGIDASTSIRSTGRQLLPVRRAGHVCSCQNDRPGVPAVQQPADAALARPARDIELHTWYSSRRAGSRTRTICREYKSAARRCSTIPTQLSRLHGLRSRPLYLLRRGEEGRRAGTEPQSVPQDLRRGFLAEGRPRLDVAVVVRQDDGARRATHLVPIVRHFDYDAVLAAETVRPLPRARPPQGHHPGVERPSSAPARSSSTTTRTRAARRWPRFVLAAAGCPGPASRCLCAGTSCAKFTPPTSRSRTPATA